MLFRSPASKPVVSRVERESTGSYLIEFDRAMDAADTVAALSLERRTDSEPIPGTVTAVGGGTGVSGRTITARFRFSPQNPLPRGLATRIRVAATAVDFLGQRVAAEGTAEAPNLPAAPTELAAWPSEKSTYVDWNAPDDGGSAVVKYIVRAWSSKSGGKAPVAICESATTSCTISGLKNNKSYFVDVEAQTESGSAKTTRVSVKPKKSLIPIGKPTVTGTFIVGNLLTASVGTWSPDPVSYKFQWLRNGVKIKGATKSTYVLGPADLGKSVSVLVTGAKPTWAGAARASSRSSSVGPASLTSTPTPTVTGALVKGTLLTAVPGVWGPAPVRLAYAWLRDGTPIRKATASKYRLVQADVGHIITVRVTGSRAGYATVARESAAGSAVTAT